MIGESDDLVSCRCAVDFMNVIEAIRITRRLTITLDVLL